MKMISVKTNAWKSTNGAVVCIDLTVGFTNQDDAIKFARKWWKENYRSTKTDRYHKEIVVFNDEDGLFTKTPILKYSVNWDASGNKIEKSEGLLSKNI